MLKRSLPLLLALTLLSSGALAADVEYSTTGTMGTPATHGGDRDGWGTDFITRWDKDTSHDVLIEEFGWPVGGWSVSLTDASLAPGGRRDRRIVLSLNGLLR